MAKDPKKKETERREAEILHACEHGMAVAAQNPDGEADLIIGRHAEDGQPILPGQRLWNVDLDDDGKPFVELSVDRSGEVKRGPSKANSHAFREGYDAIFGKTKAEKELLN